MFKTQECSKLYVQKYKYNIYIITKTNRPYIKFKNKSKHSTKYTKTYV